MGLVSFAFGGVVGVVGLGYIVAVSDVNITPSDQYKASIDNGTLTMDQRIELIKTEIPIALCRLEDARRVFKTNTQENLSSEKQNACANRVSQALSSSYAPL